MMTLLFESFSSRSPILHSFSPSSSSTWLALYEQLAIDYLLLFTTLQPYSWTVYIPYEYIRCCFRREKKLCYLHFGSNLILESIFSCYCCTYVTSPSCCRYQHNYRSYLLFSQTLIIIFTDFIFGSYTFKRKCEAAAAAAARNKGGN